MAHTGVSSQSILEELLESGISAFTKLDYMQSITICKEVMEQCALFLAQSSVLVQAGSNPASITVRASVLAVQSSLLSGYTNHALALCDTVAENVNNFGSVRDRATLRYLYGQILVESGQHSSGLEVLKQGQELFEQTMSSSDATPYLVHQLPCFVALGMNAEAASMCEQCASSVVDIPGFVSASNQMRLIGLTYLHLGDYERASKILQQSYKNAMHNADIDDEVLCSLACAQYLIREAHYDEAYTKLTSALEIATDSGRDPLIASTHHQLGYLCNIVSEYSQSVIHYVRSIELWNKLGRSYQVARASIGCASGYIFISEFVKAIELLDQALIIGKEHGFPKIINSSYHELANAYYYLNDFDACETCYRSALEEAKRTGSRLYLATCTGNLGIALLNQLKHDEALVHMQYAIEEMTAIGLPGEVARHTMNAGVVYLDLLRYDQAKKYLERAIIGFRALNMGLELANALLNVGRLYGEDASPYRNTGLCEAALLESLELHEQLGVLSGVAKVHRLLAMQYEDLQQWPKAMSHLKEYHTIEQKRVNEQAVKSTKLFEQRKLVVQTEQAMRLKTVEHEAALEQSRLRMLLLEQNLESSERELETAVRELVRKNALLEQIIQQGEKLRDYLHGHGHELLDQVLGKVSRNILPLEAAVEIRDMLGYVHDSWLQELRDSYPTVTTMEAKIATLITMNLPSESIASALCVSKRTVEFHRLNLRKKLGLSKDQGLREALYGFRSS